MSTEVIAIISASIIGGLTLVSSLIFNYLQYQRFKQARLEKEAAEGSDLEFKELRSATYITFSTTAYRLGGGRPVKVESGLIKHEVVLLITNKSTTRNTIVSIEIEVTGFPPLRGFVTSCDRNLMQSTRSKDYGDGLLPPVSLPADFNTVQGYAVFNIHSPPILGELNSSEVAFRIHIVDGTGKRYKVRSRMRFASESKPLAESSPGPT